MFPEVLDLFSMATIAEPSVKSLFLRLDYSGQPLASGTGFVAQSKLGPVLLTNWHNVTGRNPQTKQPLSSTGAVPDHLTILHNRASHLGQWVPRTEALYAGGQPRWIEHPKLNEKMDCVALPLTDLNDVQIYSYSLGVGDPAILCGPADTVSVVGFPFGLQAGGSLAVWATGFVASEPVIDFNDLPVFLIDCRSRPGQSGSAVIAYRSGGMVAMEDGSSVAFNGPVTRFLGIYSGRIHPESDLGMVWKATAIREIVDSR